MGIASRGYRQGGWAALIGDGGWAWPFLLWDGKGGRRRDEGGDGGFSGRSWVLMPPSSGDDNEEMGRLKKVLATKFEVKDLGQMRYFLRMEVARSKKGISVSQRKYTLDLLTETGMLGCKLSDTPIEAVKRTEDVGKPVDREKYQRLFGKLIYLSHTIPDIAFAVSIASQHMQSPKKAHQESTFRILRYLKASPGKGLLFKQGEQKEVAIFTDVGWAGSTKDRRSTTGEERNKML
ncbi:uncharacterized mitochondrial protein AtMg00810-like [Malania oleifera]|uniref:uncharacterized mitochondrial protein AtMg00810-like n=1 Tax=Malania oleifera TaxID=397392 RepID=UPI0025AEBCA4|nr:uncharacterized mitochondrial protein AtMg00810-like [Malania oleifera]